MSEYIDREDLLKWMKEEKPKFYTEHGYFHGMTVGFDYAIKFVEQMPAADMVEVVRCKECVKRNTADCSMYYECDCGQQHTWETDNDFCSYGERSPSE
jgi:hypothetical protein